MRLGVLVGSLRRESISRKIAKALIERAPQEFDCSIIEIGDLPLYNQDLDQEPPQQWKRFRAELAACDALLFATPEYNRSIPGCLKNADVKLKGKNTSVPMQLRTTEIFRFEQGDWKLAHRHADFVEQKD